MLLSPLPQQQGKKMKPSAAQAEIEADGFMALYASEKGGG